MSSHTSETSAANVLVEVSPNESGVTFSGCVALTKSTLTVYREAATKGAENLFIGVCSVPLIQFYRHRRSIILMRGNSFLFDNAALTAGLGLSVTAVEGTADSPTAWETVTLKFSSTSACDEFRKQLLQRHAEESQQPPVPMAGSVSASATPKSYTNHNSHSSRPVSSHVSERRAREESDVHNGAAKGATPRGSSRHSSVTADDGVSTPRSSRLPTRSSAATTPRSSRLPSRREADSVVSTPRSSRLPSRRESESQASQSVRADDSTVSSRLPSRRENESATHSLRSSQAPAISSRRSDATPVHNGTSASAAASKASSARRAPAQQPPPQAEREFRPTAVATPPRRQSPTAQSSHHHHTPSRASARSPVSQSQSHAEESHISHASRTSHRSPGSKSPADRSQVSRASRPSARSPASQSTPRRRHASHSPLDSPQSSMSRSKNMSRTEQEVFLRNVMKVEHHRIHFMQYLHKEMVHQAYLAEEAKVKAAAAVAAAGSGRRTRSRNTSATNSPQRRSHSNTGEQASRLKEIEERLAQVEVLHREAEREREDAARLRREYEVKNDELNRAQSANPAMNSAVFSDVNSTNNTTNSQRRASTYNNNGQLIIAQPGRGADPNLYALSVPSPQQQGVLANYLEGPPDDADLGVAIVDRYVYGDEWDRIFPAFESDIRFNAQMDICLALKLPRRFVAITNLVVDQPGLRVTAEIRHDRFKMERDVVERRISGCPYRFLQRYYDMRDILDPSGAGAAAALAGRRDADGAAPRRITGRRESQGPSRNRRRSVARGGGEQEDSDYDIGARRNELERRAKDSEKEAARRLRKKRERLNDDLARQIRHIADRLQEDEDYARERVVLDEAKARAQVHRQTLATSKDNMDGLESIGRAEVEVGAARQLQVLMGAHRRQLALLHVAEAEKERRGSIEGQERLSRDALNAAMNPGRTADSYFTNEANERAHRQALERAEQHSRKNFTINIANFLANCRREQLDDVLADEAAARASIRGESMAEWLELLCNATPDANRGAAFSHDLPKTFAEVLRELREDEEAERHQLVAEEERRRTLYRREDVTVRELMDRERIELDEVEGRNAILDAVVNANRVQLERRINEREQIASLLSEEAFYRAAIVQDEQDAFEVIAELFAAGLRDILARPEEEDEEDESPRRRRTNGPRTAKPFHYMTFSPEDMDYAPSAVLALEGMLGCAINKNLEVVSISRRLPKAEGEDLEFQAGDMILDVAGHSLHSLSHLREVLSNRAVQIQEEAFEEFPDVPDSDLTTSPALQKYLDVLCEHHNYLVQVLRGCDIYQIIVKS